jgi:putative tryptophan/tyrosine transport system substrate-binding protein
MRRREFIALAGAAATWPLVAHAQAERVRRVGVLTGAEDAEAEARLDEFQRSLQQLGWTHGRNVQIDIRRTLGDAGLSLKYAEELVAPGPDVIFVAGGANMGPMHQKTRTVPIVFAIVPDPVGSGFVSSLAKPGGNVTGFMQFEYSLAGKWLEVLKEIAPDMTRAAVLWDPAIASAIGQFAVIQAVAPSLGVELSSVNVRNTSEIEGVTALVHSSNGGVVVTASALATRRREQIIALAARNKLPAVYNNRVFVADGGLISYGVDLAEQFRRAAGYVDRILRGAKPADLPVQAPTKYQLAINLKTAKALGLTVPSTLIARADEVIE